MAGDPVRDAIRAKLLAIKQDPSLPISWAIKDTLNTSENPDAGDPYLEIEFDGGAELQGTFGAPGGNIHDEDGQCRINICCPLGKSQAQAEVYAGYVRRGFRSAHLVTSESRDLFITAVSSLGGGEVEGGLWVETVALTYETTNLG